MSRRAEPGFSLIEMLVALAVFSLAVLALLNLSGQNARSAALVEEQILAGMVADNRAVEALVLDMEALAAQSEGEELLAGRDWRWSRTISPTPAADMVRVDIEVRTDPEDRVAASLSVFRVPPQ